MWTEAEKALLRELKMSAVWAGIVDKLRATRHPVPRYKPGEDAPNSQDRDWIYYSGVDRGVDDLLKLLTNE